MSKESFKVFARSHPELATSVLNEKTTWQKLYELYEIYGENSQVWDGYLSRNNIISKASSATTSIKDLISTVKNIDLDTVQKGVTNLQKTIGLIQDIGIGKVSKEASYEPRPMYKYFED